MVDSIYSGMLGSKIISLQDKKYFEAQKKELKDKGIIVEDADGKNAPANPQNTDNLIFTNMEFGSSLLQDKYTYKQQFSLQDSKIDVVFNNKNLTDEDKDKINEYLEDIDKARRELENAISSKNNANIITSLNKLKDLLFMPPEGFELEGTYPFVDTVLNAANIKLTSDGRLTLSLVLVRIHENDKGGKYNNKILEACGNIAHEIPEDDTRKLPQDKQKKDICNNIDTACNLNKIIQDIETKTNQLSEETKGKLKAAKSAVKEAVGYIETIVRELKIELDGDYSNKLFDLLNSGIVKPVAAEGEKCSSIPAQLLISWHATEALQVIINAKDKIASALEKAAGKRKAFEEDLKQLEDSLAAKKEELKALESNEEAKKAKQKEIDDLGTKITEMKSNIDKLKKLEENLTKLQGKRLDLEGLIRQINLAANSSAADTSKLMTDILSQINELNQCIAIIIDSNKNLSNLTPEEKTILDTACKLLGDARSKLAYAKDNMLMVQKNGAKLAEICGFKNIDRGVAMFIELYLEVMEYTLLGEDGFRVLAEILKNDPSLIKDKQKLKDAIKDPKMKWLVDSLSEKELKAIAKSKDYESLRSELISTRSERRAIFVKYMGDGKTGMSSKDFDYKFYTGAFDKAFFGKDGRLDLFGLENAIESMRLTKTFFGGENFIYLYATYSNFYKIENKEAIKIMNNEFAEYLKKAGKVAGVDVSAIYGSNGEIDLEKMKTANKALMEYYSRKQMDLKLGTITEEDLQKDQEYKKAISIIKILNAGFIGSECKDVDNTDQRAVGITKDKAALWIATAIEAEIAENLNSKLSTLRDKQRGMETFEKLVKRLNKSQYIEKEDKSMVYSDRLNVFAGEIRTFLKDGMFNARPVMEATGRLPKVTASEKKGNSEESKK